ncbi:MAG TPA: SHOCT domain-containing protein [Ilumatobacteraceae bacterium]|nr:SHOCT domain-containing protein [Ilumatobacteraceae bacterium]
MLLNLDVVLASVDDRWGHMGGWDGGWMWVWGLVITALFVVLIVWLVRAVATDGRTPPPRDPADRAREILAERYARGELTTEEYRERIDQLR